MKTKYISFPGIFLFFLLICTVGNSSPGNPPKEAENKEMLVEQVHELFERSMVLFRQKDLDGLVDRFDKQGSLKIPDTSLITGHQAIRQYYSGTLQLENFELLLGVTKVEISPCGDMAWALADFSVSFISPGGAFSDQGNTLMVLIRIDNQWKIAAENLSPGPITDF